MPDDPLKLFSSRGLFGCPPVARPEFRTPADYVAHLDRLGVERSLLWAEEARYSNAALGNQRLLDAVRIAPERLIPAFVVGPVMMFENGPVEFLEEQLGQGVGRALWIFTGSGRFEMFRLGRLLERLAPHGPTLFWDTRDCMWSQDIRDLDNLAADFPDLNFVCSAFMWGQMGGVLDLMARRENILADHSWMHVRGAVELCVREFGAERLLFALGGKAHHGAAIAQLAHAQIEPAERDLIAHGNLERLLDLPPVDVSLPPEDPEKPWWNACRRGLPVQDVDIVDAHAHLGPPARGWVIPDYEPDVQIGRIIENMDRCGVAHTIASGEDALFGDTAAGNQAVDPLYAANRERVTGYFVWNPWYGDDLKPIVEDFLTRGHWSGFKYLPGYWHLTLDDPGFAPAWELANRHRLPILIHTWDPAGSNPATLADVVPKYPEARFLIAHTGGGDKGRIEAEELALEHPNVVLEFCGSFTAAKPYEETMERVGFDRVIFGSDTSFHDLAWELGRFLSMPVPDERLRPALGATMRGILARRRPPVD